MSLTPEERSIKKYGAWGAFLHHSQAYLGRTYIWLLRDGPRDFHRDTTRKEREELNEVVIPEILAALDRAFSPDLFNYATLGNRTGHCHYHVIPRYERTRLFDRIVFEDQNRGRNYSPYEDIEVPDETMLAIRDGIKGNLPD